MAGPVVATARLKVAAIVLAVAGLIAFLVMREAPTRTNPEVFPAFRAIEDRCQRQSWPSVPCQAALDLKRACDLNSGCTAVEYYCRLDQLGFDLPPFWLAGEDAALVQPCGTR